MHGTRVQLKRQLCKTSVSPCTTPNSTEHPPSTDTNPWVPVGQHEAARWGISQSRDSNSPAEELRTVWSPKPHLYCVLWGVILTKEIGNSGKGLVPHIGFFSSSLLLHRIVFVLIKRLKTAQPFAGRDYSSQGTLSWHLLI